MKSIKQPEATVQPFVWLTWERQVRNRSLAARFGAELVEINEPGGRLTRYLKCIAKSIAPFWTSRGRLIVVQNPSVVLSLMAVLLKPILRLRLVVDAHNAGIYPTGRFRAILFFAIKFIIFRANWVIVTNENLASYVTSLGGRPLVLPDPLPSEFFKAADINDIKNLKVISGNKVLFVCTWAADEPYCEVISAAVSLPNVIIYITGASKGREKSFKGVFPQNVVLTGYLPDEQYHYLLCSVDIVIDLTTREDCLVCGAYESVAAEKPFVLSNTKALTSYFNSGGIHAENNAEAIASAVKQIYADYPRFQKDVVEFRSRIEMDWVSRFNQILEALDVSDNKIM